MSKTNNRTAFCTTSNYNTDEFDSLSYLINDGFNNKKKGFLSFLFSDVNENELDRNLSTIRAYGALFGGRGNIR